MSNAYMEDDILSMFGEYLNSNGFTVLALSGNQQGRYLYKLLGHRKAPDIVLEKDGIVYVGEAKVKCAGLFRANHYGLSDYDCVRALLNDIGSCTNLLVSVTKTLETIGKKPREGLRIRGIVVCGDNFENYATKAYDTRIVMVTVNPDIRKITWIDILASS